MNIFSLPQPVNGQSAAQDPVGASAPGAATPGAVAPDAHLKAAAEQFEALFLQQVLKQMRKAGDVLAAENTMRSRELNTMRDFYDGIMADTLAGQNQMGIADMLVQQLSQREAAPADLASTGASAFAEAPLPQRNSSLAAPLRGTWQRSED